MAGQTSFRLYFKEGIRRIIEPRLMLMHLPKGVLVTSTCFSTIWRSIPVIGLEVTAAGLEVVQDDQSVILLVRMPDASTKRYASVSRSVITGITDLEDQDIVPTSIPPNPFQKIFHKTNLFGNPDPHRFYISPLSRTPRTTGGR